MSPSLVLSSTRADPIICETGLLHSTMTSEAPARDCWPFENVNLIEERGRPVSHKTCELNNGILGLGRRVLRMDFLVAAVDVPTQLDEFW